MKNIILKTITGANVGSFIFFACLIDSRSWVPFLMCCLNMAWFGLFGYANNWFEGKIWHKKKYTKIKSRNI